jgi:hypothetical protein
MHPFIASGECDDDELEYNDDKLEHNDDKHEHNEIISGALLLVS